MWHALAKIIFTSALSFFIVVSALAESRVARAQFSTDVIDREPVDNIGPVVQVEYDRVQRVYFFTDLREMSNSRITHQWKLDGEYMADVAFDVGGDRWRVWSSKRLMPGFDGKWSVDILRDGQVIESHSFDYVDVF